MVDKVKQGKKNRASGAAFEKRVRADLEEKGWIVDRWTNNVSDYPETNINLPPEEREDRKLVPAKAKWNNFTKSMMMGKGGFPDFIAFRMHIKGEHIGAGLISNTLHRIIGVEVKSNGILRKEERTKCQWLLKNNIFSSILIARKTKVKNRIVIEYKEVKNEPK